MKFSAIIAALSIGSAMASPIQHVHHEHAKRAVKVVTQTTLVTVWGNDQAPPTTTTSVDIDALTANTGTTTIIAVPTTSSSSLSFSTTTSVGAAPTEKADFTGGAKGVTYSPYSASGACKSLSEVQADLSGLSEFEIIRLYGVDCDQVSNVLQAKQSNQKLFLGIFFVDQIEAGIETMSAAISAHGSWDDVYTVSIGNELVNNGQATVDQVAGYLSQGRSALSAAGYSGPVVSVDTFIAIINNPGLCELSDYVAANAHAYFDGGISYDQAGDWVLQQIQRVWTACGGSKNVMITETGWPTQGATNGVAVPSKPNQETAIAGIKASCGNDVILYNAYNDYWKGDGPYGVEKFWGIFDN